MSKTHPRTDQDAGKQWYELACKRCGQRFIETMRLAFHNCPAVKDTPPPRRTRATRPAQRAAHGR